MPFGLGAEEVELEVVVDDREPEPEVEPEDDEREDEVEVVLVVELVLVELEVGEGAQDSDSEVIGPVTGRFRLEIGVLGATLTLNVYVLPPTTVIVIVQASAEAMGEAMTPNSTVTTAAASARATSSFPLLGNCRVLQYVIYRVTRPVDSPVLGRRVRDGTRPLKALQR